MRNIHTKKRNKINLILPPLYSNRIFKLHSHFYAIRNERNRIVIRIICRPQYKRIIIKI